MKKLFVFVISSILLTFSAFLVYPVDPSLVLYLQLDENQGNVAKDASNYKNDAVLKGKANWVPGKFNSGIQLGTGNYLEVKDSDSLDMKTSLTISCWVKVMGETGDHQSGLEKGSAWAAGEYNLLPAYGGGVLLQMFDLPEECNDEAVGGSVVDGTWHFIAGTWDGKNITIYIDAKESRKLPCQGSLNSNGDPLFIGCRGGGQRWVNGFIDEIKIYNRALSEKELKVDMDNPKASLSAVNNSGKLSTTWASIKK